MNQRFWDDWIFVDYKSFEWHLDYWLVVGAKHYLDPFVMPLLYRAGVWLIHSLSVASACVMAWSFTKVFEKLCWFPQRTLAWFAPMLVVTPVYQARFSGVTLEYTFSLALVSVAWHLLLKRKSRKSELAAGVFLALAIGVPSVAILFPFVFLSAVILPSRGQGPRVWLRESIRRSYILVIPVAYSLIYSQLINDVGKYRVSAGGIVEFLRGLFFLLLVSSLVVIIALRGDRLVFKAHLGLVSALLIGYICFFPYLAVGFNPVSAFLPWRVQEEVFAGLLSRLGVVVLALVAIALISLRLAVRHQGPGQWQRRIVWLLPALAFSVLVIGLGPMDWESRHWLTAWPFVTLAFLMVLACADLEWQRPLAIATFFIFLGTSVTISEEYLIDSLKQRALVRVVSQESESFIDSSERSGDPLLLLVTEDGASSRLNARFRTFRSHEWWGIVKEGLGNDRQDVWILGQDDVTSDVGSSCERPRVAFKLFPQTRTSDWEALRQFRVKVALTVERTLVCPDGVRAGWPQGALPLSE